jgi:plastocyanin
MRAGGFVLALFLGFAVLACPALAANQTVTANASNQFTPTPVTVNVGEMVTWNNTGGLHNVHFDDDSYQQPPSAQAAPWTVSRTFNNAGSLRYYCDLHGGPNGVGMSGIVNVNPRPYARPKGASPSTFKLVPAYVACTAADSTHGVPLSSASCNPPVPSSNFATMGTPDANGAAANSTGSLLFKVVGESPINPANGDQANVQIVASITDVRDKGTPANDYAGQLRGVATLRITDRLNGPNLADSATVTDLAFPFTMPCTTNGSASIGSSCNVTTTADGLMAGAVTESKRAIWQLRNVEVFDGGTDGLAATTGDNTLFAVQGLFTP